MTNVPTTRIKLLNKLQKESHGENKSKIKHDVACNDYKNERLKSVYTFPKMMENFIVANS